MTTQNAPASMYRTTEGLGIWNHRGKVAAVGIGHSPTARHRSENVIPNPGAIGVRNLR